MAKSPPTPRQEAAKQLLAEERAKAVAAAMEDLRNQLDPTRKAALEAAEAERAKAAADKEAAKAAKDVATAAKAAATLAARGAAEEAAEKRRAELDRTQAVQKGFSAAGSAVAGLSASLSRLTSFGGNVTNVLGAAGGAVSSFTSTAGGLASQFGGPYGAAIGAAIQTTGMLVSVVSQIPSQLKQAADSVASFVGEFSPLTAQRYSMAWRDFNAVLGAMLLPTLQDITKGVRFFADTAGGFIGPVQQVLGIVQEAFAPAFGELGHLFREQATQVILLAQAFAPLLKLFLQFDLIIKGATASIKSVADAFERMNRWLMATLGLKQPEFGSAGMAYVSTTTTSVQSMLQGIRQRAYEIGGPKRGGIPEQQLEVAQKLLEFVKSLPKQFADAVGKAITDGLGKVFPPAFVAAIQNLANAFGKGVPGLPGGGGGGGGGNPPNWKLPPIPGFGG